MANVRILIIVSLAAILILSLVPGDWQIRTGLPKEIEHFGAYFAVGFILVFRRTTLRFAVLTIVALAAFACAMELLQDLVPGRNSAILDAVASASGAVAGVLAARLIRRQSRSVEHDRAASPQAHARK